MAINTEITRIQGAKADIKTAIESKGVTVPANALIDSYDDYVAAIPSGGGGNQDLVDLIERDITTLTIPSGTTKIGDNAFRGCTSLASINIPSSVTSIGTYAFYDCKALTTITIPSGVTSIGTSTFHYCTSLASITIPSSVTSIDNSAFNSCSALTSVNIPSGVTSIGGTTFYDCKALTTITIPSSVTSIGSRAFAGCTSLTSVTCEAVNPPTLGTGVFQNDTNITHIYVPASSVETYKAASGWSDYASIIEAIPSV